MSENILVIPPLLLLHFPALSTFASHLSILKRNFFFASSPYVADGRLDFEIHGPPSGYSVMVFFGCSSKTSAALRVYRDHRKELYRHGRVAYCMKERGSI
ncbi:hypothetical protein BU26DRAFT_231591 [Trematosphaeria pertusa]|uniref:Uncharacterized protein n=1 Tax=Trematosphaeria pertusa TaxID=390896 RepID=A0A6A6IXJ1_9PLEO|nr:uncharacterized protein BU26DRAFT_231591 [Trematosphaeria pertusa]KAF2253903.1 hypothetical protein BU26DRAFT_231591 [Trematosphaeria pertusa]